MDKLDIKIAVISGGTATNLLVPLFNNLAVNVTYILPILDNGGSTSELIRVIGGPAIGDIRSRLTRLIPPEQESLSRLLSFRLSSDPKEAKTEWNEIVDGTHYLWKDINSSTREILKAFFVHVHVELLKRSKHNFSSHINKRHFRYELASVGNLFLTGVRLFIGSLDSAIELFAKLTGIDQKNEVIPCINTNFTYHISALLENGLIITGQSQISHPSIPEEEAYPPPLKTTRPSTPSEEFYEYFDQKLNLTIPEERKRKQSFHSEVSYISDESDEDSGSVPQYTHPELKKSQLHFNKLDNIPPLLSPIKRIFYISPYGEEICPIANNRASNSLVSSDVVVYSIGSLMTSIIPIVILRGVGKAIATEIENSSGYDKKRILLLNGSLDRETFGMNAIDFIRIIVKLATYSLNRTQLLCQDQNQASDIFRWNKYVTHLFYMKDPQIPVDHEYLENEKGIKCIEVERVPGTNNLFDFDDLERKLKEVINN